MEESKVATFRSKDVQLQLDVAVEKGEDNKSCPKITFKKVKRPDMLGEGLVARIQIEEGQTMSFVLRNDVPDHITKNITTLVLDGQQHDTQSFWYNFIGQSNYKGRWREIVSRSLMILKMMTFGELNVLDQPFSTDISKNPRVPLSLPRHSLYQRISEGCAIGTIATLG